MKQFFVRHRTLNLLAVTAITLLVLGACAPEPESNLAVEDAWARAAAAGSGASMDMEETAEPTAEDAATSESIAEEAGSTDTGMDMANSPMQGATSAVYMTIANSGNADDRLVSASTTAASTVEIHTSEMDDQGVMRMRPLPDGVTIPAGGSAVLEPGGMHIMLMSLQQDLVAGETIQVMLTFESGKTLTVDAEVRAP